MNQAFKQYIDLYEAQRALIDGHAPEVLNRHRAEAAARLTEYALRAVKEPENLVERILAPDYGVNLSRVNVPAAAGSAADCNLRPTAHALIVNDTFIETGCPLPAGVEICSLAKAAELHPDMFGLLPETADGPVGALNDLLVQDGVFIRIGANISVERPIQVVSSYAGNVPLLAVRRIVVVAERGSSASVLLCDHGSVTMAHASCRVVQAVLEENASLSIYDLEESGTTTARASSTTAAQHSGSRLNLCSLFLNGALSHNEFRPVHLGPDCTTRIGGMVIGGGTQEIENTVNLTHTHPHCTSEQLFKYALFDHSRGRFDGLVRVAAGAEFSDARQSNRNLLASEGARMYAMPQLEIYCDEVKASHGSATGRLDENALFYMRSRGIPEAEARMMLVNAFMTDVLDFISDSALRERLRHLVDVRLRGEEAVCSGCR